MRRGEKVVQTVGTPSDARGALERVEMSAEIKKRTLTNLYNARPAWLDHAHKTLDAAVAAEDYEAAAAIRDELKRNGTGTE